MNSIINTDLVVVVGKTKLITREFETIVLNCQLINLGRAALLSWLTSTIICNEAIVKVNW